ncbi:hypothetical protein DPSP01_002172 [Paraphaeosphaeria sporulosa]
MARDAIRSVQEAGVVCSERCGEGCSYKACVRVELSAKAVQECWDCRAGSMAEVNGGGGKGLQRAQGVQPSTPETSFVLVDTVNRFRRGLSLGFYFSGLGEERRGLIWT